MNDESLEEQLNRKVGCTPSSQNEGSELATHSGAANGLISPISDPTTPKNENLDFENELKKKYLGNI